MRGIVAGLVVVALAAAVALFMFRDKGSVIIEKVEKKPTRIKEVTPAAAPKAVTNAVKVAEAKPKKKSKYVDYDPDKVYRDDRGVLRYKKGDGRVPHSDEEMEKYLVKHTVYDTGLPKFKHNCEMEIAVLLTLKPGEMLFGDIPRDRLWREEFMRSLMDPTEIEEGDSDEDREIKKAVEDAKKDLVKRMKAGEDIGQILSDTRSEMRRLATYKDELLQIARETAKDLSTIEEVETQLEAVNKMLEAKGLAPVKDTAIVKHKILREIKEAANNKENNKENQK